MPTITIRPYLAQDWPAIESIHDQARKNELALANLSEAFVPLKLAAVREGLFDDTVCVALIENTVVGFVSYSQQELAWLYVDPSHARQGIGRQLIAYVLAHTGRPLHIEVLQGNQPALKLYQSMGFSVTETLSGVMPGNEAFAVTVHCLVKA